MTMNCQFLALREECIAQPKMAKEFIQKIANADALVISFAEYNGNYTSAYKNLLDWASRINHKVFQHKTMLILAASPGAKTVLDIATKSAPFFAGNAKVSISVPNFSENFNLTFNRMVNEDIDNLLLDSTRLLSVGEEKVTKSQY